jgi:signal transduction histidine kinase
VVVDDQHALCHGSLIGRSVAADEGIVTANTRARDKYRDWLLGEILLIALLGAAFALFTTSPFLHATYELPELRLVLATATMLAAGTVAVLAGARFAAEGRRFDLLLASGFFTAALSTALFTIAPVLDGDPTGRGEAWAGIAGRLLATALVAAAPFTRSSAPSRDRALGNALVSCAAWLALVWVAAHALGGALPSVIPAGDADPPALLTLSLALLALLDLVALVGFGLRFRRHRDDLDRWLALGCTFLLFAALHLVFTPLVADENVSQGDFLAMLGHAVLLVGVWRAIRSAELGRAVGDERARVAREIHDGLAQYLFAVSTHASLLESGTDPATTIPRLKEAAALAQQEARFAVLALSSAAGNAPFDAALRRYVEFVTADGALEVEVEVQRGIQLAPDEQIEVFRIVQEGLVNARKHAHATRVEVLIGEDDGRRVVRVSDDGAGFDGEHEGAGQGLRNMRLRAESVEAAFAVRSAPGLGTALELTLRA